MDIVDDADLEGPAKPVRSCTYQCCSIIIISITRDIHQQTIMTTSTTTSNAAAADEALKKLHKFTKSLPKIELHAHLNGSIREHTLVQLATERNVTLPSKVITHEAEHHDPNKEVLFLNTRPRNLEDCFEVFEYIPQCVNDLIALRRITEEVLVDAAEDGVVYIELRTGPKCLLRRHHNRHQAAADGRGEMMATKREYVETIVEIMKEFEKKEQMRYEEEIMKCSRRLRLDHETTGSRSTQDNMMTQIVRLPLIPRLIISVDRAGTIEQADENINHGRAERWARRQAMGLIATPPPGASSLG